LHLIDFLADKFSLVRTNWRNSKLKLLCKKQLKNEQYAIPYFNIFISAINDELQLVKAK